MQPELKNLRIDRSQKPVDQPAPWAVRWILIGVSIVAAHKIELAAKVVGKVAWIGVDKGDKVKAGQMLVRSEDDEYRARLMESKGQLETLKARLAQAEHGSRQEEIAKSKADVDQATVDQQNA